MCHVQNLSFYCMFVVVGSLSCSPSKRVVEGLVYFWGGLCRVGVRLVRVAKILCFQRFSEQMYILCKIYVTFLRKLLRGKPHIFFAHFVHSGFWNNQKGRSSGVVTSEEVGSGDKF